MAKPQQHIAPPKIGTMLLQWIFDISIYEEVYGDLYELYQERRETEGQLQANIHFYKDIILSVRNYRLRRQKTRYSKTHYAMLKNYWKISFRNILKNKIYSILNITGLAIGLVACFFILQYVKYERSYDQFHTNIRDLYRVQYNIYKGDEQIVACAAAVPRVGPFMKEKMPEVVDYVRVYPLSGIITYGDVNLREERMQITDPSFFNIFSFPLLSGDTKTALSEANTCVVSESLGKKLFGNDDPIGKRIQVDGRRELEVTGVAKDAPKNSHLKFNLLISYQTLNNETENESETAWGWYDFNTYVLLKKGSDPNAFDTKFDEILWDEHRERWEKNNYRSEFPLQAVSEIHLYSDLLQESEPTEQGDGESVFFLSIIAVFILIIAWINYINLSTAKSIERAKEVGIRKVIGAHRLQLISQFIIESFLLNLIAFFFAFLLVLALQSTFFQITGIRIDFGVFSDPSFWQFIVAIFIGGALLAGLYPAFVLSSFNPLTVLKTKAKGGGLEIIMRKILVVFQFATSVGLIIGTMVVFQQMRYMQNMDLGFSMDKTLVVKGPRIVENDSLRAELFETYKIEALRNPNIRAITKSTNVPGKEIFWTNGARKKEDESALGKVIYHVGIDYDYFPAYQIAFVGGRNFDLAHNLDTGSTILNYKALSFLGFNSIDEALDHEIVEGGNTRKIVGVVKDYNQMSPKSSVAPLLFLVTPRNASFFTYKLENDNFQETLAQIESSFQEFFPGNPFEYYFLEDYFNEQYAKDNQFSIVFITFTLLAIIVACLGLFGLSALSTLHRSKEIGIRKTMGASIQNIVFLLSKEFLILVLIANIIAWPFVYYFMNSWLEGFANRIDLHWSLFVVGGILVSLIAFLTVAYKTIQTANSNPIKALRYQ